MPFFQKCLPVFLTSLTQMQFHRPINLRVILHNFELTWPAFGHCMFCRPALQSNFDDESLYSWYFDHGKKSC